MNSLSLKELSAFSPAFRSLMAYRDKGYVSLMHVQAQIGHASQLPAYDSSTDEESTAIRMGGLQCCTECAHNPIKPLRS